VSQITAAEIDAAMSAKGGFSKETFAQWGVPWPPPKGWKGTIIEHGTPYNHSLNLERAPAQKLARKWARKLAKRAENAARKEANSVTAYQRKHLVLVTADGKKVFNNVREHASRDKREAFYQSWEWRTLRVKVLKKYGRRCQCCGATPANKDSSGIPVRIVVDHIKPLSKYWQLRLIPSNLQVLCDECNQGKGAWDETDHRFPVVEETDEDHLTAEYRAIMREDLAAS
jgi:5-methylcytosine-specific restriction endonuclease McrA